MIVILGTGGHARVLADALLAAGRTVAGFTDADPARYGRTLLGLPVLGGDDAVPAGALLVNGLGSIGDPGPRIALDRRFTARGFRFASVIHPAAVIGRDVEIGDGAQVMAGAVIQTGCRLGRGVIVNTRAVIDHDGRIGDFVHVAPGAVLSGGVSVGSASHIGTGASVIQGIAIGRDCRIAAGAVVVADLADGARVAGGPAR